MNPLPESVPGLIRIRNQDEFSGVRAWLVQWRDAEVSHCVYQSGEMLLRAQGRAQVLQELLARVDNAPELAAKLKPPVRA